MPGYDAWQSKLRYSLGYIVWNSWFQDGTMNVIQLPQIVYPWVDTEHPFTGYTDGTDIPVQKSVSPAKQLGVAYMDQIRQLRGKHRFPAGEHTFFVYDTTGQRFHQDRVDILSGK